VYGVPGIPVYETFGACAAQGLRVIGNRNQQASALMAVAQNYVAGRQVAAALVSAGVAASNALTGALVARDNCWPLVLLAGAASKQPGDVGHFMTLDTEGLYRSITKWSASIESTADIAPAIAQGCEVAMSGRPGPVLIELPEDILCGRSPAWRAPSRRVAGTNAIPSRALDEAADRLVAARRPLLIIGKGTRWSEPFGSLAELVDRLQLPFVTSPIARGYVPDDHPFCFNAMPWEVQREADVVLLVGARLDWTFRFGTQFAADADLIQVDIHAPELGRNRATRLAVEGDAGDFLRGLHERLRAGHDGASTVDRGWIDSLRRRRDRIALRRAEEAHPSVGPVSPNEFASAVDAALPADAVCVFDANLVMAACQRYVRANVPLSRLTPGSNGCMGTGIPFAIGAKMQNPARPVVAICGDFAFGLHAFEMETAIRHDLPIVVIVANNDGNSGALRQKSMFAEPHPERVAMFQPGVAYHKIVESFGGHGEHVADAQEIGPALRRALDSGKPSCINVPIDPDAPFPFN
jgi:2-hydroxyacyl-CoA lyase 1